MSTDFIKYILYGTCILFLFVVIAYLIIRKQLKKSDSMKIQQLRVNTKQSSFSPSVLYQKLYVIYIRIPVVKRYMLKLRRRLEIMCIDDEYLTRKQTAAIMTKALVIVILVTLVILMTTSNNFLLLSILLIFEIMLIETVMEGMVDKIDNKILKQQVDMFAELRHSYHEYNMVEEAIYDVAQKDEMEVSRQAEKIYEILISSDPETELEKYYDIAPNSYLKEFAGVSYLTKEFGDRKSDQDGASLYLKNVNNITQEMQIEILKRDKLDYVFQSLSVIAALPILFIEPLKSWAVSQFAFTDQFYSGKIGLIMQIAIIMITFICYILIRKLKDNGGVDSRKAFNENPWQEKIYKTKIGKKIFDLFIPKKGTTEYRKINKLLKDTASKQKMEWFYINRVVITVLTFIVSIVLMFQLHRTAIDYVYTEPTADYNVLGQMSEQDMQKAMDITIQDNYFLEILKTKDNVTIETVRNELVRSDYYEDATEEELDEDSERIFDKYKIVTTESLQWFEILIATVFAVMGYYAPVWFAMFQMKMRQMDMENEVMQFQTIILMLMKIERVNVEIILEWLERYSNIFKEPITKCVNNFESGGWEALEELKNDVTFPQFIRIIESLQQAVEKIPIVSAFDELDTEREYYQEKRKQSNEKLLSRKGLIGKAIGFAPMVCLFVGYLIAPLMVIGLTSMTDTFSTMSTMM